MNDAFAVRDLGRLGYREAWRVQRDTHAAVASGATPPTLLWVEHPPVITFGRKGGRDHLLLSEDALRARGFELVDIERGGDVTYHGPGQLVGYPILPVARRVRDYLRRLEGAMVDLLGELGIDAHGTPGYAGVWVGDEKVAAIGVAIQRGVSFHGFALNVRTDLSHFETIVPCGIADKGVTSLSRLCGRDVSLDEAKRRLLPHLRHRLGELAAKRPVHAADLPAGSGTAADPSAGGADRPRAEKEPR